MVCGASCRRVRVISFILLWIFRGPPCDSFSSGAQYFSSFCVSPCRLHRACGMQSRYVHVVLPPLSCTLYYHHALPLVIVFFSRCSLIFRWDFPGGFSRLFSTWDSKGAKECRCSRSYRFRKMLKNAPTLAIRNVDTAENEPSKVCQSLPTFANICQNLPKFACTPRSGGRRPPAGAPRSPARLALADFGRFWQTLEGSFSAVSTFLIARVGAFFRILNFHSSTRSAFFCTAPDFKSLATSRDFVEISVKIFKVLGKLPKSC